MERKICVDYTIAIISGLLFGALVALAKHIIIWRPYAQGRVNRIYGRMAVSSGVNVLALLLVVVLRNRWPYSFTATIAAAALSLSLMSRLLSQIIAKNSEQNYTR